MIRLVARAVLVTLLLGTPRATFASEPQGDCAYVILVSQNTSLSQAEWGVWVYAAMAALAERAEAAPVCGENVQQLPMQPKEYEAAMMAALSRYEKARTNESDRSEVFEVWRRTAEAGFLPEYLWNSFSTPAWGVEPEQHRKDAFLAWMRETHPGHVPHFEIGLGTGRKTSPNIDIMVMPFPEGSQGGKRTSPIGP